MCKLCTWVERHWVRKFHRSFPQISGRNEQKWSQLNWNVWLIFPKVLLSLQRFHKVTVTSQAVSNHDLRRQWLKNSKSHLTRKRLSSLYMLFFSSLPKWDCFCRAPRLLVLSQTMWSHIICLQRWIKEIGSGLGVTVANLIKGAPVAALPVRGVKSCCCVRPPISAAPTSTGVG